VATGFEHGNLLVENELCQFIVMARRTRLHLRTRYTRLQTNRKSLVPNEKQLAANLRDELSIFPSRGDWTPLELFLACIGGWEAGLRRNLVGKPNEYGP
jgi:hypothetical protein